MSQRITKTMLQNAVETYVRTLRDHNLLMGELEYTEGIPSSGIPWSIRYPFRNGNSPLGIEQGILGHTAREAYDRLHTIIRVLNDIEAHSESL